MEGIIIIAVLVLIWFVIAPFVALARASDARSEARQARTDLQDALARIGQLENEMSHLGGRAPKPEERAVIPQGRTVKSDIPRVEENLPRFEPPLAGRGPDIEPERVTVRVSLPDVGTGAEHHPLPPPLPTAAKRRKLIDYGDDGPPEKAVPEKAPVPVEPAVAKEPAEPFSLEKFMGVKLFAWLGGVAMFFGVIFFVKYAFENNLISPSTRIILGFLTGTGLLAGGLFTHRLPRYRVLAQAFCATGVLILYGVSFAAHAIYHFPLFGTIQTFSLMACITCAAFFISVRLNALVVAVLGMLGGFMTPVLLSTGQDQVLGLFGYIALLDAGLLAVSRHNRWHFLVPCAAAGTALTQIGWFVKFFSYGGYAHDNLILIPMGIQLGFIALFLVGGWIKRPRPDLHAACSVFGLSAVAVLFSFVMLGHESVAERLVLLYGFLLLVHLGVIATVLARPALGIAQFITALLGFLHLACWTQYHLTDENLHWLLGACLVFGALHAVVPVLVARYQPARLAMLPQRSGPWFAPLVLVMMLIPIFHLPAVPPLFWGAVLMADLLVIVLAIASGALLPVLVSLLLTMGVAGAWLFKAPADITSLMPFLGVITGFSALFTIAGKWLYRGKEEGATPDVVITAAVLPFVLLLLALGKLPVPVPTPVFLVALLMTGLLTFLGISGKQGKLMLVALTGTFAVEGIWYLNHFKNPAPGIPLAWFLGFYSLFLLVPFILRKRCADLPETWIAAALSGVAHFLLVHSLVKQSFPNDFMGLVPAAFAVPSLIGMYAIWKWFPGMDARQQSRLAWFGGVALLFITLVFPIQFERQWITVSWAIEGALLLWLFRRVPHPGLQFTGLALLLTSFVRLALNPVVFTDYARGGTPILNWHLYAYGLVAAAHFLGATWLADPHEPLRRFKPRGTLLALGGILLFLLLNIEIADYFTAPGDRCVAFNFGGNFARDMTYSIAWGLFSLGLLGLGFRSGSEHARFAAVGLLVVTLLKVFLHDLAAIQNIFRIGALVGVAVIAFIASFLYQKFFEKSKG
ncbi:DUF2339 domain-containing protein [Luteolibacter yonseiensis]|uniref:DUF2339 domain-containing protein n=1 Tax=Luteolibacter yonseiensis TaxID=1144680 RepID=A0A934V8I9_9BACT|nr:DUF2339 domain-containing protein [Luteolibacter yonseiensis]MBK1814163.1 DUF2339 domain-containing protein [Luteolibacter yonseiensis]